MARPTCEDCAAYNALEPQCRRHAPTILSSSPGAGQIQIHSVWPPTKPGNWCCDFIGTFPGEKIVS